MSNTTADKLQYLTEAKALIKTAIEGKGQIISSSDTFKDYATKINNISTGTDTTITNSNITNVKYSNCFADPFTYNSNNGHYELSGVLQNCNESLLIINFTLNTAGTVKLNYKGTSLSTQEDTYVEANLDEDVFEPLVDSADYADLTFSNVSVGNHTLTIAYTGIATTSVSVILKSDNAITSNSVLSDYSGFVNDNKINGTYKESFKFHNNSITWHDFNYSDIVNFIANNLDEMNIQIDCTGESSISFLSSVSFTYMKTFFNLINTSSSRVSFRDLFNNNTWPVLETIPQFDTSGITDWADSMHGLTFPSTLKNIPLFDMSGCTNQWQQISTSGGQGVLYAFSQLDLSIESLNNIMGMVLTLPASITQGIPSSFKKLSNLGFDISQMTHGRVMPELSNYAAFVIAGWNIN